MVEAVEEAAQSVGNRFFLSAKVEGKTGQRSEIMRGQRLGGKV